MVFSVLLQAVSMQRGTVVEVHLPDEERAANPGSIGESPFAGMWKDRTDVEDSVEYSTAYVVAFMADGACRAAIRFVDGLRGHWAISQVTAMELIAGTRDKRDLARPSIRVPTDSRRSATSSFHGCGSALPPTYPLKLLVPPARLASMYVRRTALMRVW